MRIHFIEKNKVDILVLSDVHKEIISKCIPKQYSVYFLKSLNDIPFILSVSFLLSFINKIFKYGVKSKTYIGSLVDELKPNLIMTYIDNTQIMGELDLMFPEITVLSIQNGARLNTLTSLGVSQHGIFPYYFGFGLYERDLIKKNHNLLKEYFPVGSLKMGLFLSKYSHLHDEKTDKLCFVSQYVQSWENTDHIENKDHISILKDAFINTNLWAIEQDLCVNVVMRNSAKRENFDSELEFFRKNEKNGGLAKYHENIPDEFSSYKVGFTSMIVISLDSTLAFELYGCGVKVFFCSAVDDKRFTVKTGISKLFANIPKFIIAENLEYSRFSDKLNYLASMEYSEYLTRTKESRQYYMNCKKPFAHEAIANFIESNI